MPQVLAPLVLELSIQRSDRDCGVCALQMLLGCSYLKVYQTATSLGLDPARGFHDTEIMRVAERLGVPLVRRRAGHYDLTQDTGVLALTRRQRPRGHYVVLFQGVVVNPADGFIYDQEAFFASRGWSPRSLLMIPEGAAREKGP